MNCKSIVTWIAIILGFILLITIAVSVTYCLSWYLPGLFGTYGHLCSSVYMCVVVYFGIGVAILSVYVVIIVGFIVLIKVTLHILKVTCHKIPQGFYFEDDDGECEEIKGKIP